MLAAAILVIFPFCMVFAAVSDALSMTISNRISIILVAGFAFAAPLTGMDWATYGWHFAAFALVLAVTFALFALRAMGGGDAKLMAATALWMGFGVTLVEYLTTAAVLGGALTLALVILRVTPVAALMGGRRVAAYLSDPKAGVPYGIALGASGLITAPNCAPVAWALAQFPL